MNVYKPNITLKHLTFTGKAAEKATVSFDPGLTVLFGASNTGKSFAVKAVNFMLGGSQPLPDITERRAYNRAWLGLDLPDSGAVTLVRALAGGAFEFYPGDVRPGEVAHGANVRTLSARHDRSNMDNLSQFLLEELGIGNFQISKDANGNKRTLSFRDLARFCIVDETAIQSEISPALSGQYQTGTAEKSIFKLLLTGVDDSAIVPVVDRKTYKVATNGKIELLDQMIEVIDEELTADYPLADELPAQWDRLEATWMGAQRELDNAQVSISSKLVEKKRIAANIRKVEERRAEVDVNIGRFRQLRHVYDSDMQRLEAIEEAGFLLGLGNEEDCPLCGAPPESQKHVHRLIEVDKTRAAANAEIEKIKRQSLELDKTLEDLQEEGKTLEEKIGQLYAELKAIEQYLADVLPAADAAKARVDELLLTRDRVKKGLSLLQRRQSLLTQREELASAKPVSSRGKPQLGVPGTVADEFAQMVSTVLTEWQFPGQRRVSFEEGTFDLRIDGKNRRDNGKGVRAITHAAFKVALLLFCRERGLPHPGFLVLDTPLLTYRDPLRSKEGPLSGDEQELKNTSLKDFFFEHLSNNSDKGQFIVVENIDMPKGIEQLAKLEVFTGDQAADRAGLFITSA